MMLKNIIVAFLAINALFWGLFPRTMMILLGVK